jgi:hypothetical protein
MKLQIRDMAATVAIVVLLLTTSCKRAEESPKLDAGPTPAAIVNNFDGKETTASPSPAIPNLQLEILENRNKTSASPLASIDFRNYSYPLPRGWQNPDNSDARLTNGRLEPIAVDIHEEMSDEEKVAARSARRIGMSYVTTKYMDVTGDGQDEAFVILKIETTGSAIPQIVYVYTWKNDNPELIWYFGTGDRADGGLKDLHAEDGKLVVELYGQDRFLLGEAETHKITDDEEQLCCPTYFTRTAYKWNGKNFQMDKDRWTYAVADPAAAPQRNLGEIVNAKGKPQKPARK